jgi:hypothetical protein
MSMKIILRIPVLLIIINLLGFASEAPRVRLVGPRISIAAGPMRNIWPAAAFNPVTKQFLITWTEEADSHQRIRGRFVNLDGTVDSIRNYSPISNTAFNDVLRYSPVNNCFLLFSSRDAGLYSQLISDSGQTLRLTSLAPESLIQSVSFQRKSNRFFVAGFAESALLVDIQGKVIKRIEFPNSSVGSFFRQVVLADPNSSDFILIGQQPETLKIFVLRFSSDGSIRGNAKKLNVPAWYLQGAALNPSKAEIVLLLGNFDSLHTIRLNQQFSPISNTFVADYRWGDLRTSHLIFADGKYIVCYSRDEKLWMRMLGSNGNPIGDEVGLGPILDFSFRKLMVYSPLNKIGLLVWESSKSQSSDIRYIFSRRFRLETNP